MAIQGFFTGDVKIRELNGVLKAVNGIVEVATDAGTVTSVGLTVGSTGTDVNVANSPITSSGNITLNLPTASATNRGLLSSADWTTFNNKQAAGNYVTLDTYQTITASKTFSIGFNLASVGGTNQPTFFENTNNLHSGSVGSNIFGFNTANNIYFGKGSDNGGVLQWNNSEVRYYTLPNLNGTLALTSQIPSLTGYVPYTGATGDVDLGVYKLSLNKEQFASISAPTYSEGLVWYDSAQKSLSFYNDSSLSPVYIGENIVLKVYNNTGSTISKGAPVYIQSGGSFTYPNVALAKADSASTAAVIGLMNADTPTGSFGYVTSTGVITGVNTGAYSEGTILYLSPYSAGQLMNTVPPTGYAVQVGVVAHSNSPNGTIYTKQTTPLAISASTIVGTLAVNQGGTGATTASGARTNLGLVIGTDILAYRTFGTAANNNTGDFYLSTNPSNYIALTALSATAPLSYSNTTGVFSISQATTSTNGYLSSTDWNTFNNKQTAGSYITALTGEATASGPGSASVTLSTSAVTGKLLTGLNLTGGGTIAATDSILQAFGKVQNQISGMVGGVTFQGTWDASTNTPTLTSSVGTKGYYYIVDVAGSTNLNGITDWKVGDWAIFNGSTWDKVDNTDAVSSVNGFTGAVSLTTSNIAEGTNLYYLDSRARLALSFTAGSGAYNNTTGVITIPTNTSQLTNGANFITLSSLSASSPLAYNSGTGAFSIQVATGSQNGYLSSTDWNTFNGKQAALNGTGFVKASGTTISYDNSTYVTIDTFETITASKNFALGLSLGSAGGTNQASVFQNTSSLFSGSSGTSVFGFNSANNIYFGKGSDNGGVLQWNNSAVRYYTLPNATGTIALTSDLTGGTVTSVGLSSATSGVTIGSTPITTSGTITLAIATASGSQQGLLSSTDWTTFNNKQNALTNPVTGTGTTNYLPKFTGASTIGNSIVSESSGIVSVAGRFSASGNDFHSVIVDQGSAQLKLERITTSAGVMYIGADNVGFKVFDSAFATRLTLTSGGNLGLGVTPSAWTATALQGPSSFSIGNQGNNGLNLLSNAYYGSNWTYITTAPSSWYQQINSEHRFYTAPSGTAGNAISFTQAMTLNASGNLSIGNTNDTFKLDVTGTGRFSGQVTVNAGNGNQLYLNNSGQRYTQITFDHNSSSVTKGGIWWDNTTSFFEMYAGSTAGLKFYTDGNAGAAKLTIASTGAATFSSSVQASSLTSTGDLFLTSTGAVVFNSAANFNTQIYHSSGSLVFYTGANERARITSTGSFGIGTSSPSYKLEVNGTNGSIAILGSGYTLNPIPMLIGQYTSTRGYIQVPNQGSFEIWNGGTSQIVEFKNNSQSIFYGNVGIGTTSPGYKLDILGSSGNVTTDMANGTLINIDGGSITSTNFGVGIAFVRTGSQMAYIKAARENTSNEAGFLAFATQNSAGSHPEAMRISSGGNVEINTGSIKTGAPTDGTAQPWKLGDARSGGISTDSYIIVSVNGVTYSIPALNGLP